MIQDLVPNINLNNLSEPNENVQSDPNNEHLKDEFRSLLNAISKENDHGNTSSIDQVKEIKNSSISHFQHREDSLKNEHVISNSQCFKQSLQPKNAQDYHGCYWSATTTFHWEP